MQAPRGDVVRPAKKPKKRTAKTVMEVIAKTDADKCAQSASKIQKFWRQKLSERHVGNVRMIYSQVRNKARERGVIGEDGEVHDLKSWNAIRDEVCHSVLDAAKSTQQATRFIEFAKQEVVNAARIHKLKQALKFQYALITDATESKRINEESWRELYTSASEAAGEDLEVVLDDKKIFKSDQAARRIQQAWTVKQLSKLTRERLNTEPPIVEAASSAEGIPSSSAVVTEESEVVRNYVTERVVRCMTGDRVKELHGRVGRLRRLRQNDALQVKRADRHLIAAATHVQRMQVGKSKRMHAYTRGPRASVGIHGGVGASGILVPGQSSTDPEAVAGTADMSEPITRRAKCKAEDVVELEDVVLTSLEEPARSARASEATALSPELAEAEPRPPALLRAEAPSESAEVLAQCPLDDVGAPRSKGGSLHLQPSRRSTHRGHLVGRGQLAPLAKGRAGNVTDFCLTGGSSASHAPAAAAMPLMHTPKLQSPRPDLKSQALSMSGASVQAHPPAPTSPMLAPRAPAAPPPTNAGSLARARLAAPIAPAPAAAGLALAVGPKSSAMEAPHKLPANTQRKHLTPRMGPADDSIGLSAQGIAHGHAKLAAVPLAVTGGANHAIVRTPRILPKLPAIV